MSTRITRIEAVTVSGKRPRPAGSNARLGVHGDTVRLPLVRLVTGDGQAGFGRCPANEGQLRSLLGQRLDDIVEAGAVKADWSLYELPVLDLAARIAGQPVYRFAGHLSADPVRVVPYDTSLYFDDLDLADHAAAADRIAGEALEGVERGFRAFKIKVGRGARHLPLEQGTVRDIAVINAVREAVGPEATVMIDANDGWNLNLTKRVLAETAGANLHWLEEAFHEDAVLYEDLKRWMAGEGLSVLVADGEGAAHPSLVDWARDGVVDVVQYDIHSYGFGRWASLGASLDGSGIHLAPHAYGGGVGPHVICHLAGMVNGMGLVEWDLANFGEVDMSAWVIRDGALEVPDAPGFGLELDEAAFAAAVKANGIVLT